MHLVNVSRNGRAEIAPHRWLHPLHATVATTQAAVRIPAGMLPLGADHLHTAVGGVQQVGCITIRGAYDREGMPMIG